MFDVSANLSALYLLPWLWLVPVFPGLAFAVSFYLYLTEKSPDDQHRVHRQSHLAWRASHGLSLIVVCFLFYGRNGTGIDHLFRLMRIGRVDVSFDFALDLAAFIFVVAVLSVSVALSFIHEKTNERFSIWVPLVTGGALITCLSDNIPTAIFGGALASLGVLAVAPSRPNFFFAHRVSDVLLLLGIVLLAWALGGGFAQNEFVSDMSPRLVTANGGPIARKAVNADEDGPKSNRPPRRAIDLKNGGTGTLTFSALPESIVSIDDHILENNETPLIAFEVPAGQHVVRVHPGNAVDDTLLSRVVVATGQDTRIVLIGPTTSFLEANEQLGVQFSHEEHSLKEDIITREVWSGTRLSTLATFFIAFGVLLRLVSIATVTGPIALVCALGTWPFLILLARLAPWFALETGCVTALFVIALGVALVTSARAIRADDVSIFLASILTAKFSLVAIGFFAGATHAALLDGAIAFFAFAVLDRALKKISPEDFTTRSQKARGPSAWSLVFVGAAFSILLPVATLSELTAVLTHSSGVLSALFVAAITLVLGMMSFAFARVFVLGLAPRKTTKPTPSSPDLRLWLFLAVFLVLLGTWFGFDARFLSGEALHGAPLVAGVVAALGVFGGAFLARRLDLQSHSILITALSKLPDIGMRMSKRIHARLDHFEFVDDIEVSEPHGSTSGLAFILCFVSAVSVVAILWVVGSNR